MGQAWILLCRWKSWKFIIQVRFHHHMKLTGTHRWKTGLTTLTHTQLLLKLTLWTKSRNWKVKWLGWTKELKVRIMICQIKQNCLCWNMKTHFWKNLEIFEYLDKLLIILSVATHSISIASFATAIGAPVGIMSASYSLAFSITPKTLKYWTGVQQGQSYLTGRRCLFSLGWPPFYWWCHNKNALWGRCFTSTNFQPTIFLLGWLKLTLVYR